MPKKKKKIKSVNSDLGTFEAKQHGDFVLEDTMVAGIKRVRNITVDPIETLHRRNLITPVQYNAASRFAHVFRQALLTETYATVRFGEVKATPSLEMHEAIAKAKSEVRCALNFVGNPLASLIEHTVGGCRQPSTWAGGKASVEALRLALDGLVTYYKM